MTMIDGPSGPAETTPRDWGAGDPYDDQDTLRTLSGSHVTRQEVLRQIAAHSQPYDPVVVLPGTAFVATENGVRNATEEEITRSRQFDKVPPVPPTPHRHAEDNTYVAYPGHRFAGPSRHDFCTECGRKKGELSPTEECVGSRHRWIDWVCTSCGTHLETDGSNSQSACVGEKLEDSRRQEEQRSDMVNHPPHYGGDVPYEAIKVIEAWGLGFCLGNAVKYISRADHKGTPIEDLRKSRWYLDREIMRREQTTEEEH